MTETSYNGWPAIKPTEQAGRLRTIEPVPGVRFRIVDNDDVAVIFTYLVQQYHKRVEPVTGPIPDDWGYNYRPNANNPSELSNHASATALDINATQHPNGVPTNRTFTPEQILEIDKILSELQGTVTWGGDYIRTPDAMHWEISAAPYHDMLRIVADKIREEEGMLALIKKAVDTLLERQSNSARVDKQRWTTLRADIADIKSRLDRIEKKA